MAIAIQPFEPGHCVRPPPRRQRLPLEVAGAPNVHANRGDGDSPWTEIRHGAWFRVDRAA